ncbi:hypothetical protein VPH35_112041 [Triticum aestivum]|uniref:uncharacterized protein n=1 Tax=Triticum aestivum TaxID=4565 RepID=UPI001D015940|nr:uncharacterized protein LOC123138112 [Triticum aestivum]XP_044413952.1 uncharacterized protein LOC123138112 [Triticum aestivum]
MPPRVPPRLPPGRRRRYDHHSAPTTYPPPPPSPIPPGYRRSDGHGFEGEVDSDRWTRPRDGFEGGQPRVEVDSNLRTPAHRRHHPAPSAPFAPVQRNTYPPPVMPTGRRPDGSEGGSRQLEVDPDPRTRPRDGSEGGPPRLEVDSDLRTTNRHLSRAQYIEELLDKAELPQRREVTDQTVSGTDAIFPPSRPVFALSPTRLTIKYYVRVDMCGFFHTYPTLSGPFQSLQEVQDAINSEHAKQCEMMCMDGLSMIERKVRRALYWPDGIRRNTLEAQAFEKSRRPEVWMLKALLDKYNDDNNLSEDIAYELVDILCAKAIREPKGSL